MGGGASSSVKPAKSVFGNVTVPKAGQEEESNEAASADRLATMTEKELREMAEQADAKNDEACNVDRLRGGTGGTAITLKPSDLVDGRDWRPGGTLKVLCVTWNMEGSTPSLSDLEPLVPKEHYHIYAFGSQECLRTIGKSFFNSNKEVWEQLLKEYLGSEYHVVGSETLMATHIIVFVRQDLKKFIDTRTVGVANEATGLLGGKIGNKGGVAVGFTLCPPEEEHAVSFLFIAGHFAAHQDKWEERNKDYLDITSSLKLGSLGSSLHRVVPPTPQENTDAPPRRDVTSEYDVVFFMGDFNYRVNGEQRAVASILERQEDYYSVLLANDQLRHQMERGRVFQGFKEGPITFRPTYKFVKDKETGLYSDSYSDKEERNPSWTDRILYRQHPGMLTRRHLSTEALDMQLLEYTSVQHIRISDHRPVRAVFMVPTPLPNPTSPLLETKYPAEVETKTCAVM